VRIAPTLAPILLLLPVSVWSQQWGADKQTFDVRFGFRHVEATFTVAEHGFGWHQTFTSSKETFNSWESVTAWCSAPGTVLFRSQQHPSAGLGVYELKPEDLVAIVDGYFKKYAADAEWSGAGWECTSVGLSRPHPAKMSKIRELLEAASSEEP
jgi:hypothetical protein